jgi:hypothetical protein
MYARGKTGKAVFVSFCPNRQKYALHDIWNFSTQAVKPGLFKRVIPRELKSHLLTVLRIRYVYPGSCFFIHPTDPGSDPGSRFPDPRSNNKKRGGGKN